MAGRVTRSDVERRTARFVEACENLGMKLTSQRLEIFRELASSGEHPDAESIWQRIRRRIPSISQDTVYRNLKLLGEHGLISVVGMSCERLRFDANMDEHHHFVCTKCGLIRDFRTRGGAGARMPDEAREFGDPVSVHLEVKGVCRSCRAKGKPRRRSG